MNPRLLPFDPRSPRLDPTDSAWSAALDYLRPRRHLDHVNAEILAAFLAGARHERGEDHDTR